MSAATCFPDSLFRIVRGDSGGVPETCQGRHGALGAPTGFAYHHSTRQGRGWNKPACAVRGKGRRVVLFQARFN